MADTNTAFHISAYLTRMQTSDFGTAISDSLVAAVIYSALGIALIPIVWVINFFLSKVLPKPTPPAKGLETGWTVLGYVFGFICMIVLLPFIEVYISGDASGASFALYLALVATAFPCLMWLRNHRFTMFISDDRSFFGAFFLPFLAIIPALLVFSVIFAAWMLALKLDQAIVNAWIAIW